MKKLTLLCILSISVSCDSQQKDYSELKYVYQDLVEVFKTMDDNALKEFTYRLAPDKTTLQYMRENHLCYRGIPCQMDQNGIDISAIGDNMFSNLLRVRNSMQREGLLENLEHVDSTVYKWETETVFVYLDKNSNQQISESEYYYLKANNSKADDLVEVIKHEIKGTEMGAVFQSGDKIISYHIGEMLLINNKWSLFTKPGLDYY